MAVSPEQEARQIIDALLQSAGWAVQDRGAVNLYAARGVAVREFHLKAGYADYLLFVDRKAIGVVEAKAVGTTLLGVAEQSAAYAAGLPDEIPHFGADRLPFICQSTGIETHFRDERDPDPRSRRVFAFHQPDTLAEWAAETESLRTRLQTMPPLLTDGLWKAQIEAIENLETSFANNHPRALIQMATGSGKTFTSVSFVYRLLKFARAKRVLFLVDRNNLGRQTFSAFDQYVTPDDGRKLSELYNVQRLRSNIADDVSKVHITTIQRLFSMLTGEEDFDSANEEASLFSSGMALDIDPGQVVRYNPEIPIEYYDFIITDECHRSIYNLWRQVLEYFDAFLIGLTATPSKQTFGFFNRNLVMEYPRERAVADGVNVDGEVYRIRTQITAAGSTVKAGHWMGERDRQTRAERWDQLADDFEYDSSDLDRRVVAKDQIRTIITTFKDKLFTDIFPGRTEVPKTLIFAKDDSHAEDIVQVVREVFGKGDDFCKKITYRVTGVKPEDLISDFRNSFNPRIAVSVDMIATGTDIKPLEIIFFMRAVKSRVLFEQMLGRGTRVVSDTELANVTPDARHKDHFVIIDAVEILEQELIDPKPMERKRGVSFKQLLEAIAVGAVDDDTFSSLAGRLARLDRNITAEQRSEIEAVNAGKPLSFLIGTLLDAVDPDKHEEAAQEGLELYETPTPEQIEAAAVALKEQAKRLFAANPDLRKTLLDVHTRSVQRIDEVSQDVVLEAGYSEEDKEKARGTVESFRAFIEEHRDEIAALEILYGQPRRDQKLTFAQVRELAEALKQPPHAWTTEKLWRAYHQLEQDRVRDANGRRVLTDLVSLVRHAVELEDELVPYPARVKARYHQWLADQEAAGKTFTDEQRWWLDQIAEHIGVNLGISLEDFNYGEFFNRGGQIAAANAFGSSMVEMLEEIVSIASV